jgi:hypothetical protein
MSVFQTLIWADDFRVSYLPPLLNSLPSPWSEGAVFSPRAGAYSTLGLPWGLTAKALVFLDEVEISDFVGLNFDTKVLGAFQAGLSWAPRESAAKLVEADYAAVAPYMYTSFYEGTAQDDYTHDDANLGPELLPNSDRLELRTVITPGKGVEVECSGRLMRHGNASEGVSGSSGDGGLSDSGWAWDPSAPESTSHCEAIPDGESWASPSAMSSSARPTRT